MQTPEPSAREMVTDLTRALRSRRRRDAYRACDRIIDAMGATGAQGSVTLAEMPPRITR